MNKHSFVFLFPQKKTKTRVKIQLIIANTKKIDPDFLHHKKLKRKMEGGCVDT
jgi:hypothetical protein